MDGCEAESTFAMVKRLFAPRRLYSSAECASLPTYGRIEPIDSNGTSFTLTTSDDKNIRVVMQDPLNEYLAGLTEVQGTVDQRNQIQCQNYITYDKEVSDAFNMSLYNTAVELMARAPQFYMQGVQEG